MHPSLTLSPGRSVVLAALLTAHAAHAAMVGYWNFNEGSGTTVNDLSTRNNDGGTLVAGGGGAPSWISGHTGNAGDYALQFHGYTDRVPVPIGTSLNLSNTFTIALWAKSTYLGGYPYLLEFTNDSSGSARQWFIQGDNYGGDQMYMYSDADTNWRKGLGFKVGGGGDAYAWHHYAFKYSGGVVTPYVDGVARTPQTISGSPNFPAFTYLIIGGKNQAWTSWEGPIDDVVIFNSAEDVTAIMNGTHSEMTGTGTVPVAPTVTTGSAVALGSTSARLAGNVTGDGGAAVSARGVVVAPTAVNNNPLLGGTAVTNVTTSGTTGAFTVDAGGLAAGISYTFKAYATNSTGTGYGATGTFTLRTATTFHVSQSTGNDAWSGTAETAGGGGAGPWKTLAKVASANLIPGDRILLKAGDTWNEELKPTGSGTPDNPILITSYGTGARPVIDRQDYTQDRVGIRLTDQEGFKIVGIEFYRCMTGIYADYSDNAPTRRYIWIEDCYFHESLLYQHYEDYPAHKIGLGICFFSYERDNRIVLKDITIRNCVFRRLTSGIWTNSPDNFNQYADYIYNFGNMTIMNCLFEEGKQWQLGIRGVAGGAVRGCVTHDIGRIDNFTAWNGVAGAMFFRAKDWVFEDSEWGFVSRGGGSGDGEAFDFEGNCDNMFMRNCLFHDTAGPGFLVCVYASNWNYHTNLRMENCVLNGKSTNSAMGKSEIYNTSDINEANWTKCRFYLSPGAALMKVADPDSPKRSRFGHCLVKNLGAACSTTNLASLATITASSETSGHEAAKAVDANTATSWKAGDTTSQWLQLDFPNPLRINEFRLKEDAASSIIRYVIQYWDDAAQGWFDCFNGRAIGADFVAPVVSRSTRAVRLEVMQTTSGNPGISEFGVYYDTSGAIFNDPTGAAAVNTWGN